MNLEEKLVESSVKAVGEACSTAFVLGFYVTLGNFLGDFGELKKKFEDLNLDPKDVVMGELEKSCHLVVKQLPQLLA